MFRNNYQQSEDSVTKISRSKSRNQVSVAAKLREKVLCSSIRKVDGMNVFISITSLNIITKINPTHNVFTQ